MKSWKEKWYTKPTKRCPKPHCRVQFPTFLFTNTPFTERKLNQVSDPDPSNSHESGVYGDESGLELGLALCIGTRKASKETSPGGGGSWEHFVSMVSSEVSSSSSTSSSSVTKAADTHTIQRSVSRQVIGWPPVRTHRMNNTVFAKAEKELLIRNSDVVKQKGVSCFVKVTMDGVPIGRKMDLGAHKSYKTLLHTVNELFAPSTGMMRLMNGFWESAFVLTYKDKDGDWMLVGDVPWDMFVNSVMRLRIMRRVEANGLA